MITLPQAPLGQLHHLEEVRAEANESSSCWSRDRRTLKQLKATCGDILHLFRIKPRVRRRVLHLRFDFA
jgi:hypothetical protein